MLIIVEASDISVAVEIASALAFKDYRNRDMKIVSDCDGGFPCDWTIRSWDTIWTLSDDDRIVAIFGKEFVGKSTKKAKTVLNNAMQFCRTSRCRAYFCTQTQKYDDMPMEVRGMATFHIKCVDSAGSFYRACSKCLDDGWENRLRILKSWREKVITDKPIVATELLLSDPYEIIPSVEDSRYTRELLLSDPDEIPLTERSRRRFDFD